MAFPLEIVYPRYAESHIRMALRDTRVVAISGPRQSGKTTLARRFARRKLEFFTLDSQPTLEAARSDPVAFVSGLDRAVIGEVQRAPDLIIAIKHSVDKDPRPGRFLLTGSANLLTIATVRECLAGRVEIVPLYPLGCSERRRQDWYRAYIDSIIERDLPEIANLAKPGQIPRVLEISARFAGQLTNLSEIGRSAGLDHKTAEHYLRVLEQLYLIQRIQPWFRNELSRIVKTPKLHFIDPGLLTAMRGYSMARIRADRQLLGPLLEGFVFSELLKQSSWTDDRVSVFHYRDRDKFEVDFVLENPVGQIVGIEVKAAASVTRQDFAGLHRLASAAGTSFVQGILLYNGEHNLSFAENLRAVPLPALWA